MKKFTLRKESKKISEYFVIIDEEKEIVARLFGWEKDALPIGDLFVASPDMLDALKQCVKELKLSSRGVHSQAMHLAEKAIKKSNQ